MDNNSTRYNVQLYIYDLSRGMARNLSPIMLGEYRPPNEMLPPPGLTSIIQSAFCFNLSLLFLNTVMSVECLM